MVRRKLKAIFVKPDGHEAGSVHRTGRKYWHGDTAGYGHYNFVGHAIAQKTGGSNERVVEKRFFREYANPERNFRALCELKAAGANVVPGFRLALTRNPEGKLERSLVMADLTQRGRLAVFPSNDFYRNEKVYREVAGLKNYGEIMRSMTADQAAGFSCGYWINSDRWMIAVDRKKKTGTAYLTDVDDLRPAGRIYEERDAYYLKRAGITPQEVKVTARNLRSIVRKASRPHSFAAGVLARETGVFEAQVKEAALKAAQSQPELFNAIRQAYVTAIGVAVNHQIGGCYNKTNSRGESRESLGLSKDQRRKLHAALGEYQTAPWERHFSKREIRESLAERMFPQAVPHSVPFSTKKSKLLQWNSIMIGKHAAEIITHQNERLGKPLFAYDAKSAAAFDELTQKLKRAHSAPEARRLLARNRQVLANRLVQVIGQNFKDDLGTIARLRLMRDLPPFARRGPSNSTGATPDRHQ
ncbi:MAG: hypothetical protein AABW54_04835 [Candidatus Micrarchaeota archaeon]